jgi:TonB family protein
MLAVLGLVLPQPMPFAPARAQDNAASVRCAALPMDATQSPPTLKPPPDWQGKSVSLQMQLNRDGAPMAVSVARPSGSPELDAAAMAHVQQAWRWQPLHCGDSGTAEATIAIPQLDSCMAQRLAHTMTPPPTPPTGKGVARQAQLNLSIGRDGTVQRASKARTALSVGGKWS